MKLFRGICILLFFSGLCIAQSNYAMLLQESPVGAGEIKPGLGIQTFDAKENVTLTTVANPGYHFVGWLGDVKDPTANRTTVSVDGPKIIIAVFERDEFEMLSPAGPQISVGPGALYPNSVTFSSGGGSWSPPPDDPPPYYPPDNPRNDPPPVPEIPEPATIILFAAGTFLSLNKRNNTK